MTIALGAIVGLLIGSFLAVRCGTPIGVETFALELATAGLFALLAWHFRLTWELGAFYVLAAGLVALSTIDLHTKRLPREITYLTLVVGGPLLVIAALVHHEPRRIATAGLGAAISFAIMLVVYLASRGGMGDGDVRLSPLLGTYLGWLNPGLAPVGLLFGFLAGALAGVVLIATRSAGRTTALPFGPFLALGTIVAVFAGQPFVDLLWARR